MNFGFPFANICTYIPYSQIYILQIQDEIFLHYILYVEYREYIVLFVTLLQMAIDTVIKR